ncbi:MAG: beta-ketoacyl synthase chain length factor [Paludibacteraceae bacterium]|nr:beta-ketoacyl synthase chain length factor [Paludibacteraceae bacterium]
MQAYINSVSLISPQLTHDGSFLTHPLVNELACVMNCVEPVYKEYINPVALRRMSHVVKLGLAASAICMRQLPDVRPEAVIIGSGLACLSDLEKFTRLVEEYKEETLPPIPFINSAHNTVAAQIAMQHKLTGYNITYCHHFLSFESALRDAFMCLSEDMQNVLVGGIDERTSDNFHIYNIAGFWRKEPVNNLDLFKGSYPGTLNGEGAAFFILSNEKSDGSLACVTGVHTLLLPNSTIEDVNQELEVFLKKHSLSKEDIDLFILGRNGSNVYDSLYGQFEEEIPQSAHIAYYKHLCGEYMTSSSFAMWVASNVLSSQSLPDILTFRRGSRQDFHRVLIYNQALGKEHAFILLERA